MVAGCEKSLGPHHSQPATALLVLQRKGKGPDILMSPAKDLHRIGEQAAAIKAFDNERIA
jgi:hypothetical protein